MKLYQQDGITERPGEIRVNFPSLIAVDSLISRPPQNLINIMDIIGDLDKKFRRC